MGYHTERNIHFMIFDDDWLADWQTDALPDSYRNGEVYDKWFIMLIDWFWEQTAEDKGWNSFFSNECSLGGFSSIIRGRAFYTPASSYSHPNAKPLILLKER